MLVTVLKQLSIEFNLISWLCAFIGIIVVATAHFSILPERFNAEGRISHCDAIDLLGIDEIQKLLLTTVWASRHRQPGRHRQLFRLNEANSRSSLNDMDLSNQLKICDAVDHPYSETRLNAPN